MYYHVRSRNNSRWRRKKERNDNCKFSRKRLLVFCSSGGIMKYGSCKLEWVLFPGAESRVWLTSSSSFCSLATIRKKCQRETEIDRLARSCLRLPCPLAIASGDILPTEVSFVRAISQVPILSNLLNKNINKSTFYDSLLLVMIPNNLFSRRSIITY